MKDKHDWTYEEVLYCTNEIFNSFVLNRELDYQILLDKLYFYFNMKIDKGSLKMFFSNQKHLFIENNVPNTLFIAPLTNASAQHVIIFNALVKGYVDAVKTNKNSKNF